MEQQSKVKLEDRLTFISNINSNAKRILEDFDFLSTYIGAMQIEIKKDFGNHTFQTLLNSDDISNIVDILYKAVSRTLKDIINHKELSSPSNATLLEMLKEIEALYKKDA